MKKTFTFIFAALFAVSLFGNTPVYTVTAQNGSNSGYATSCVVTVNNVDWTVEGNCTVSGSAYAIGGWGLGGKKISGVSRSISCQELPYSFDSLQIIHKKNNGITVDSFYIVFDNDTVRASEEQLVALQDSGAVLNFKFKTYVNPSVKFVYVLTNTPNQNKRIEFYSAEFYLSQDVVTNIQIVTIEKVVKYFDPRMRQICIIRDNKKYNLLGERIE